MERHTKAFNVEAQSIIDGLIVETHETIQARAFIGNEDGIEESVYEVPYSQNYFFSGRDQVLSDLRDILIQSEKSPKLRACVVHGMGGMGKTQVALEYVYRYRKQYTAIFWISAGTSAEISQTFSSLARRLCLPGYNSMTPSKHAEAVMSWLKTRSMHHFGPQRYDGWLTRPEGKQWLLVFDNAEKSEDVKPYWPNCKHGTILLTSQKRDLSHLAGPDIQLEPLDAKDGGTLLLKHLRRFSQKKVHPGDLNDAARIARVVDGLPIAIAHIAGCIDQSQLSLTEFIDLFEQQDQARRIWEQGASASTHQYGKRLNTVWDIALRELDSTASDLLNIMSMLSPARIPEKMLIDDKYTKTQ